MVCDLYPRLCELESDGKLPRVTAYHRLDGPGSSLDLREFQQAFWSYSHSQPPAHDDPSAAWSRHLPRTVGITIDSGCIAEAHPLPEGKIGVRSFDYGTELICQPGTIPHSKDYWLVKAVEVFGLRGVMVVIRNLKPGVKSSGLGGSATATTAVCVLANELAGRPFSAEQIVAMASLLEQDFGVSITGTQEQSNVVFGGVCDYVWFPWGVPSTGGAFGSSIRFELVEPDRYNELSSRLRLYHTGEERASTNVNSVWRKRLRDADGFALHRKKLGIAYEFREGLRLSDWDRVSASFRDYRAIRTQLCSDYMTSRCWDIQGKSEPIGAEMFPLGAGGGGAAVIFAPDPDALAALDERLSPIYRPIPFSLRQKGYTTENIPDC